MTPRITPFGRALWHIETHSNEELTQGGVAQIAGVSRVHLTRVFGLGALLNSHLIDAWFRSTNGSTQVSATEIRAMPLPPLEAIRAIGREAMHSKSLAELDEMVERLTGSREREIARLPRRTTSYRSIATRRSPPAVNALPLLQPQRSQAIAL